MKLLLDIGNTRIKWVWQGSHGLQPGGAVVHAGRSPQTALEAIELKASPTAIWAANVAGTSMTEAVNSWSATRCNLPVNWATSTRTACGVHNAYARPERLGVDRWLAVIAAHHRSGGGAACVVDAGTALTIDVVDDKGRHRGGLIAPGVQTQRAAIRGGTRVHADEGMAELEWLARDTNEAVGWGTLHAALGLIQRVHTAISRELGPMTGLLTGGEAELLAAHLGGAWTLAPDLVLEGLARLAAS